MDTNVLDDSFFSCSSSCSADTNYASAFGDDSTHLRDQLEIKFFGHVKNLNIVHINAQSIHAHYEDILTSFDCHFLDAILISETFLKPGLPSTQYPIPGFRLVRNDRIGKGYGGVGIYLRADIPCQVVDQSPGLYSNSAEYLFLEIVVNHAKILLGVYYPPSRNVDYFSSLESKLETYTALYDHTILLGDFNTCLLKNDSRALKLLSIVNSVNMHILPLSATHHAPHSTPSLLDLVLVSDIDRVATHGQLPAPFSYHDLVFLSYKIRRPKRKPKSLLLRSFKDIDLERLKADADNIDWSPVVDADGIDDMVAAFNAALIGLYDVHAPLKLVKIKHAPAPWLSPLIKKLMSKRDKAKRRYKNAPNDENFALFKKLRNRCSKLCRDAKRRHIHSSIQNCSTSQMWKFLKTLGVGKTSSESNVSIDLNLINTHFSKSPLTLEPNLKKTTLEELSRVHRPDCPTFSFDEVTEVEVIRFLKSISTKAVGVDGVNIQMLQLLSSELSFAITHILNFSLLNNTFPSAWKKAFVIPLPKTPNPSSVSHFRPISILPILSKLLEYAVHKQLSLFLSKHGLLSHFQSGFRPGHSTVSALTKVTDDIRWAMDNKLLTVLVLLDFSSAFNSVDHDILLSILSSFNISPSVISWFKSYLSGRSQCVRSEESSSEWCDVMAGVPQGGILSPLLFSAFINALTRVIDCSYHLYADDLQLYRHFKAEEINEGINQLNADLNNINAWAKAHGLLVNPSKSQVMIVGTPFMLSKVGQTAPAPVMFDGAQISLSNKAKNLGVIFDSRLSWGPHINEVSKRVNYSFQSLKRLQKFLPIETKIYLAQTLLLPLLDYADVCFLDATEDLLNKLERLQNLCIRFIFGLRKFDHVSNFRSQLKWLPIRRRHDLHVLTFLYKILHNPLSPSYLRDRFDYLVPRGVPCRTAKSLLLRTPPHSSSRYGGSFTVHAIQVWNSLPHSIRASPSINCFKNKVKEHFLSL